VTTPPVVPADRGGHDGHSHGPGGGSDARLLAVALALIAGFMVVEVVLGLLASSLALIADAGHMLSDAAAIALALVAMRLAARPARGSFTFGLRRAEILSAQANGVTLLLLAVYFLVEAVRRLVSPPAVQGGLVLVVALVGVVVNLLATWVLSRADRRSLNVEGSFQHILTDLYAFVGTAIAGLVVLLTGWNRADPVASILVALLMARAGFGLVRESGRIFLEAAPRGTDPTAIERGLREADGVVDVHDLHVWEVSSGFPALSAHVLVDRSHDCHGVREALEALLAERFGISHTTLQVDHRGDVIAAPTIPVREPGGSGPAAGPSARHPGHP
jgi:cobalt-zinc-cadmium efflux system protein